MLLRQCNYCLAWVDGGCSQPLEERPENAVQCPHWLCSVCAKPELVDGFKGGAPLSSFVDHTPCVCFLEMNPDYTPYAGEIVEPERLPEEEEESSPGA